MQYFSTNRKSPHAAFKEAVLRGQPEDKGLYFPEAIPRLSNEFLVNLHQRSNEDIAFNVIQPYVGDSIPQEPLFAICAETVNFPFPLVGISETITALELFHGPTLAFKDVGARFMSRCLQHFSRELSEKTIVLVATSGDTGGAVASGFFGVEGIEVVILYPKGKVSKVQELQLTTLGGNVTTLELHGTFDDCQRLAKQAIGDAELRKQIFITSANSINIARWLPQQFYYFFALKQWEGEPPILSVPSGNFGNLASGVLAHVSGLPVIKFIAACNANDVVPRFFESGEYEPKPSVSTLSNAMDVGDPSNFVRILEIFSKNFTDVKKSLEAVSISDQQTAETMRIVNREYGYVLDPHGAVAYRALVDYIEKHPGEKGIILETAHPVKFDSVTDIIGEQVGVPDSIRDMFSRAKVSIEIGPEYATLKEILLERSK